MHTVWLIHIVELYDPKNWGNARETESESSVDIETVCSRKIFLLIHKDSWVIWPKNWGKDSETESENESRMSIKFKVKVQLKFKLFAIGMLLIHYWKNYLLQFFFSILKIIRD